MTVEFVSCCCWQQQAAVEQINHSKPPRKLRRATGTGGEGYRQHHQAIATATGNKALEHVGRIHEKAKPWFSVLATVMALRYLPSEGQELWFVWFEEDDDTRPPRDAPTMMPFRPCRLAARRHGEQEKPKQVSDKRPETRTGTGAACRIIPELKTRCVALPRAVLHFWSHAEHHLRAREGGGLKKSRC